MLTDPIIVDRLLVASAFILPILLVICFKRRGIVLGAFAHWAIIGASGPILSSLDPERVSGVADSLWILAGWVFGLIYSALIYSVLWLIRYGLQRLSDKHPSPQNPDQP